MRFHLTALEGEVDSCSCGSSKLYSACCGRFIEGTELPVSAEQLMRSRYTGFVLGKEEYLLATWHPKTRPSQVRLDPLAKWLGLRICAAKDGGSDAEIATVEFVARFKVQGRGHRLHEISRFEKIDHRWYYLDGEHL